MKISPSMDPINVIFDLDGTLIDSQPGIIASLKFALAQSGFSHDLTPSQVPVGPPLLELIQSITNSHDNTTIDPIISKFKEHYDHTGFRSSLLFDGVYYFLASLYYSDFNLFIATNKRLCPTLKILEYLSIAPFFKDVYAVDSSGIKFSSKSIMIKELIDAKQLSPNIIYLGDRYDDYIAASDNSIPFCYPLWGYCVEHKFFPDDVLGMDLCTPLKLTEILLSLNK